MQKINIKKSNVSINLIRKYCSIISNATAIPFSSNQAYKEYDNIQGLWNYDISSYTKALIEVRKKNYSLNVVYLALYFQTFYLKEKLTIKPIILAEI